MPAVAGDEGFVGWIEEETPAATRAMKALALERIAQEKKPPANKQQTEKESGMEVIGKGARDEDHEGQETDP